MEIVLSQEKITIPTHLAAFFTNFELGEVNAKHIRPLILNKILTFLKFYIESLGAELEKIKNPNWDKSNSINKWYREFFNMHDSEIIELIVAAEFFGVSELVDVCASYIAHRLTSMTPEVVIEKFKSPSTEVDAVKILMRQEFSH